jgi:membrane protein DedA with SNARE-associated domain
MVYTLLETIGTFIMKVISTLGLPGIVSLMAIESACIPLPSEVIMPFSGFLASKGRFSLLAVSLAGTAGCLIGSIPAYYLGKYGGRPIIEKYGKYLLMSNRDLDVADRWFKDYGEATIFFARLLPVVRTFIAFPAGVARMNLIKFSIYTILGSFPWCFGLAYVGYRMGKNWPLIREYFHKFDLLIGGVLLVGIIYFIYRHLKNHS